MLNIEEFWNSVITQSAEKMKCFFADNAIINWHCTNEQFTVNEFVEVNCKYPGEWNCDIEKTIYVNDALLITVVRIYDKTESFHAISFLHLEGNKIISIDEYWGDDGKAPDWRRNMHIGRKIQDFSEA